MGRNTKRGEPNLEISAGQAKEGGEGTIFDSNLVGGNLGENYDYFLKINFFLAGIRPKMRLRPSKMQKKS